MHLPVNNSNTQNTVVSQLQEEWCYCCTDVILMFLNTGIDYLSVAADDDLVPAHLVFFEGRVRTVFPFF